MREELVASVLAFQGKLQYTFRREDGDDGHSNCFGLVHLAARQQGVDLPNDLYQLIRCGNVVTPSVADLKPFDFVLTKSRYWGGYSWQKKDVGHLYVATGWGTLVHLAPKVNVEVVSAARVMTDRDVFFGVVRPRLEILM